MAPERVPAAILAACARGWAERIAAALDNNLQGPPPEEGPASRSPHAGPNLLDDPGVRFTWQDEFAGRFDLVAGDGEDPVVLGHAFHYEVTADASLLWHGEDAINSYAVSAAMALADELRAAVRTERRRQVEERPHERPRVLVAPRPPYPLPVATAGGQAQVFARALRCGVAVRAQILLYGAAASPADAGDDGAMLLVADALFGVAPDPLGTGVAE